MTKLRMLTFVMTVLALFFLMSSSVLALDEESAALLVTIRLRDYRTGLPVSNVSITALISSESGEEIPLVQGTTNETGVLEIFLGNVTSPDFIKTLKLRELSLSGNYVVIKINDLFMENVTFEAVYVSNSTNYTRMHSNLRIEKVGSRIFLKIDLYALKGKVVKIADCDPLTGEKQILSVKPAVLALNLSMGQGGIQQSEYESYYLFPLDYLVTIIHTVSSETEMTYPALKVSLDEGTTLINWMYHAAKALVKNELTPAEREMKLYGSLGFPVSRESEDYQAIKDLLNRALDLLVKGEYGPAIGGIRASLKRLFIFELWMSNLKTFAVLTSISVCIFAYGLSSLLPQFVFEERVGNKTLVAIKVLIFSSLLLAFSFTNPSLKMTFAVFISDVLGLPVQSIDLPMTLWGCFLVGSVTYFLIILISLRKSSLTDLALKLGVKSLRRRRFRTVLTLITVVIIVSSAVVLINTSLTQTTAIKETWKSEEGPDGVIIQTDITIVPLSEYDINWTRMQSWCKDLGYSREVVRYESRGETTVLRDVLLISDERTLMADIVEVNSSFVDEYYNLTDYVKGFRQEFLMGKPVIILSDYYDVQIGDYVTLAIDESIQLQDGSFRFLGRTNLGSFEVVGKFDPVRLQDLKDVDNQPLFKDATHLVLLPIKTIKSEYLAISKATIITKEGFDPVDIAKKLAYALGVTAIANRKGLAMKIEWSLELQVVGLLPYLFPLAIAGLMVYVTMISTYEERKKELTTLAVLGLDPKSTFQMFLAEALILGSMATFLGFFGSYMIVMLISFFSDFLKTFGVTTLTVPVNYVHWSLPAVLVAILTGAFMTFLGGFIPAMKAYRRSLLARTKKRRLTGELLTYGDITTFTLPLRVSIQSGEMLYRYIRGVLGNFGSSLVDSRSVKGQILKDGTFTISFTTMSSGGSVFVPCEVKGNRKGENLTVTIEFPAGYRNYGKIRDILRELEKRMIAYPSWKELQQKMKIVRETPKREKTPEEVLMEIRTAISQIKDGNNKLKMLEEKRSELSEEIYNEFKQKYIKKVEELSKNLRAMAIRLEPYHNQLQQEMKKVEIEIQRITTAYTLGEIKEEEYVRTCGPLQARMTMLQSKTKELDEIFEFLRMPSRMI